MASPEDLSSLRSPLSLGVSGLTQLLEGYHAGTEEIRRILTHDCDVIMECRTCRSLYRGLPNFLAHRRCYCNKPTVPEPTDQVSPPTGKRVRRNNKARIDLRPKMRSDITAGGCPDSSKQEFPEIVEPPPPAEPPELELEPKKSVEPLRLPEPPRSSRSSSRRQATLESGRTSTFSLEDYTCPHCPYSHPVVRNVVQHVISRHHYDKDKAEYYKLKLKELGDRRRESLLQNLSSNRTTRSTTEAPQGTMLCPLCPKTCVRVRDVINHLISKHKLDSEKANSYKNDIVSIDDDKEVDQERRRKKSVPEKCETSADGEKDVSETDTKSVPSTSETMSPTHMESPPSAAQDVDPIDSPTKSQEASVFASNDISAKNISVGSGFSLWQCTLCTKLCGNESAMMAHINLCKGDSSSESESRHDKESAELDSVDTSLSETVKDKVAQSNVSGEDVVNDTFDEPLPEDVHNQVAESKDEASDLMEMVADECTISKDTDELLVSEKDIVEVVKEKHSEGNESGGKHNVDEPMPKDVESESAKLKEVDEASEMNIDECTISKDTDELLVLEEDIVEVVKEKHSKEKESGEVPGKHNVDEPMPKDVDDVDEALEMNTDECGISNDTDELLEKEIVDTCDTKQVKDVEISELDTSVVDRANTPRSKSECADSTDSNRASENDIDQSSPSDINDGAEQESNESFQRYNIVSKDVSPKVTENDLPSSPSGEEDDSPQGKNNDGKNLDKDEVSVPKDVGSGCAVSHESDGGSERDTVDESFPENMEGEEIIDQLESSPLQICGNECTSESALIEVQTSEALERKAEEIIEHENAMQEDVSIEAGVGATLIFDEGVDVKGNELDEASEKDDVDMLNKLFTTVSKEEKLVVELSRDHNSNHEMKLLQASVSEQLLVKHSESSHERKRKLSDSESEESVKRCCLEKVEMPSTQTLVKTENQDSSSDDNQTTWSWFDDDGSLSAPMDDVHSTKKTAVKREEKAPVESNRALTCPECSYKSCRMYEIERHLRTEHKHFSQRDIMAYKRRFRPSRWRSQISPKRKPFTRRMITLRKIGSDQSSSSVNHETFADTQLSKDVDEEQLALNSDEVDEATMESVETHSNQELINESQVEVELPSPAPVLAKPEPQEDSRSAQSAIIYPSMPVLEKQEPLTNTQINADSPMPSDPVQTDHQTNEATLDLEISDDAKQESHKTITDANRSQDPCYEEARDTEEMIIVDGRKSPEPDNDMDNFDDSECTPEKPFYDTSDEGSTSPTILPDSATLAYFAYRASGHPYRSRRRGVVGVHSLYRGADQEPRVDPGRRQGGPGKMDPPQSSYTALACVECAVELYDLLSMVRHLQNQHCWNMVKISRSLARITESVTLRGDQIIQESIHTTAAQCSKSAKSGKHKKVIPRAKSKKCTQNRGKTTAAHRLRTEHDLAAKSCTASTKSDTQSGRKEKRSRCAKLSHKISSCKPKGKDYTTTTHNKDASETIVEHSKSMDGSPVKIVSSKSGKKFYYKLTTKCAKAQYNNISKSTSKNKSKASVKTSKKTSKATSERTARNSSVPSRFTRRTMADKRTDLS